MRRSGAKVRWRECIIERDKERIKGDTNMMMQKEIKKERLKRKKKKEKNLRSTGVVALACQLLCIT